MTELFTVVVVGSMGVTAYALLRVPSWLFASMNRGTLWTLRDCTFDARRSGHLPNAPEVSAFLTRIESMIIVLPSTTALQIWWLQQRGYIGSNRKSSLTLRLSDAEPDQQRFFLLLQDELRRIVFRHYMVGSWSGLLFVAPRHWQHLRRALRRQTDVRDWLDHDRELPPPAPSEGDVRYSEIVEVVEQVQELHGGNGKDDDGRLLSGAAA